MSATPATFNSAVSAAASGQTICLASGNYGTWNGTSKAITIAAASGSTPTMQFTFGSGDGGFTLDGIGGMGGMISGSASNITIQNSTFTSELDIEGPTTNIVINHDDFSYSVQSTPSGPNAKIYLETTGGSPGAAATIENNEIQNGDLDGIHIGSGSGDLILDNEIANLCDRGVNHTDNIQFEEGTQIRVAGNYVHEAQNCPTQGITSYDGDTSGLIIEDNVVDVPRDWGIELYSDQNSIVRHNTVVYHPTSYSEFQSGDGQIDIDRKSQDPAGSGTHVYDNIATVDFANGSTGTQDHNVSGQRAIYVGPLTTYAGFKLASNSPVGLKAASDELDDGARIGAGAGPPPTPPPTTTSGSSTPPPSTGPQTPSSVRRGSTPPPLLVASFGFDELSGATVRDDSGLGNNGTIHGAKRTGSGKHGGGLVFNGRDDYVSVPDSRSLDLSRGMTLAAWVRPAARGRVWRSAILKQRRGGLAYGLYANNRHGEASGWVRTAKGFGTGGGPRLALRRWSYLAATYNGHVLRIYVNGVLRGARRVHGAIPPAAAR